MLECLTSYTGRLSLATHPSAGAGTMCAGSLIHTYRLSRANSQCQSIAAKEKRRVCMQLTSLSVCNLAVPSLYRCMDDFSVSAVRILCIYCTRLCHLCRLQLFAKLQATKQEIVDLQEANARERQELEQTQNELTRELKLKLASSSSSSLLLLLFII